jgi:hypothetical protein
MVWLGYLGAIYAVFVQGTFAGYHYLPGLALGAILVGSLFALATERLVGNRQVSIGMRHVPVALVLASVLLGVAAVFYLRHAPFESLLTRQFLNRPVPNEYRNETVFDFTESYDVAEYIRARTRPDDRIQIWGDESLVYYLADRRAASRFQSARPLVTRTPGKGLIQAQRQWRAEFLADVERLKPVYVAVVREDNWWWAPEEQTSEQLLNDLPEWKEVIEQMYALEKTIGRFLIYRIRA